MERESKCCLALVATNQGAVFPSGGNKDKKAQVTSCWGYFAAHCAVWKRHWEVCLRQKEESWTHYSPWQEGEQYQRFCVVIKD